MPQPARCNAKLHDGTSSQAVSDAVSPNTHCGAASVRDGRVTSKTLPTTPAALLPTTHEGLLLAPRGNAACVRRGASVFSSLARVRRLVTGYPQLTEFPIADRPSRASPGPSPRQTSHTSRIVLPRAQETALSTLLHARGGWRSCARRSRLPSRPLFCSHSALVIILHAPPRRIWM